MRHKNARQKQILDLSDKGRSENKKLQYEVLYTVTDMGAERMDEGDMILLAKFRYYVDAHSYADDLAFCADCTKVIVRN